jgi:hypothetical protein
LERYSRHIQYFNGLLYIDSNNLNYSDPPYMLYALDVETGKEAGKWLDANEYNGGWMGTYLFNNFFISQNLQSPKYAQNHMSTVFVIENDTVKPFLMVKTKKWMTAQEIKELDITTVGDYLRKHYKIHNISDLIEGNDFILFKIWEGYDLWNVLRLHNGDTRVVKSLKNDLLFKESIYIWKSFCTDEKGVYFITPPDETLSYVENGHWESMDALIRQDVPYRERLFNIIDDDNPIVLYFEYE